MLHAACRRLLTAARLGVAQVPLRTKKSRGGAAAAAAAVVDAADVVDVQVVRGDMTKVVAALEGRLNKLRTAGAAPEMLDDISVDAYGTKTALRNVANVAVRDARTLAVAVHDPSVAGCVERAIRGAGLGLNPVADGRSGQLKVPVPRPDKDARAQLQRVAKVEAEKARMAARGVRRDAMGTVKKANIRKQEAKTLEKDVQKATDEAVADIDRLVKSKLKALE